MQGSRASLLRQFFGHLTRPSGKGIASLVAIFTALLLPAHGSSQTTLSGFEDTSNLQQDVFFRGTDEHIYFRYFSSAQGWLVQDVTTLSGAPLAASFSSITSFKDDAQNQQHVVFEGADGHIYQAYSNSAPSSWSFQDVTSITGSGGAVAGTPLASYCDSTADVQYIAYIGQNQDVNVLVWYGAWGAADAGAIAGAVPAAAGTALTGFAENQSHNAHVFYQGTDQHLHELYAGPGSTTVGTTDVTAASGSTTAATGTALTGYFDNSALQESVYFLGTDQHIHHLSFNYSTPQWATEDVTALGGGPAATAGSSLSSFGDVTGNQQHVFYVGTDQHLHQFYYSSAWYPDDLTADVGAQVPALTSPLTSFKDDPDNQQHAFYLGSDSHFYHYWFDAGWHVQDLTSGAAPPAL